MNAPLAAGAVFPNIKNIVTSRRRHQEDRFIPSREVLKETVEHLKKGGHKIVLTQGVYDLLHRGHNRYLEEAKECGDILIVGVDSDELTRKRKPSQSGVARPFDPLDARTEMLLHTRHVDIVTVRDVAEGLDDLIELVCPDVFVMSKTTKDFPEEKANYLKRFCGEIKILEAQADDSTTARIRRFMDGGASELAAAMQVLIERFTDEMRQMIAKYLPISQSTETRTP